MKKHPFRFIRLLFISTFFFSVSLSFAQNSEQFLAQNEVNMENATNAQGWHLLRVEYVVSKGDGAKVGYFSDGSKYTDTSTGKGARYNFTTTYTRTGKNGVIASGSATTVWTDPPKFFTANDLPSITVKRTVESSWGINMFSIGFDWADINPGSASAGKIDFATPTGETHVQAYEGIMTAKRMVKGNKHGEQKAITLYLNGYAYKYYYEWHD